MRGAVAICWSLTARKTRPRRFFHAPFQDSFVTQGLADYLFAVSIKPYRAELEMVDSGHKGLGKLARILSVVRGPVQVGAIIAERQARG